MIPSDIVFAVLAMAFLLALLRVFRGPSLADRAMAAEVCLVTVVGAIALLAVRLESTHFWDVIVVATLLQFISTVALGRLLERKQAP